MPKMVMTLNTIKAIVRITLTNRQKSSFFLFCKYSEKTGTTAALVAPSPTKSLNKLGILKATKVPQPVATGIIEGLAGGVNFTPRRLAGHQHPGFGVELHHRAGAMGQVLCTEGAGTNLF